MILTPFLLASVAALTPTTDVAPTMPVDVTMPGILEGWTGNWNVGLTYVDGNTDVKSAAVNFDAERQVEKNRYSAKAYWMYTEQSGVRSQRTAGGELKYDRMLSEKTYGWVAGTVMTDELAMLDLRWTAGAGIGQQYIDMGVDADGNKITKAGKIDKLRGELGLVYFNEEFDDNTSSEYLAARAMYDLGMDLTETARFEQTVTAFPSLEDSDDFYARADSRIKMTLTEKMFAQIQWIFNYDNTPAAGADRRDNTVILGLGWSF